MPPGEVDRELSIDEISALAPPFTALSNEDRDRIRLTTRSAQSLRDFGTAIVFVELSEPAISAARAAASPDGLDSPNIGGSPSLGTNFLASDLISQHAPELVSDLQILDAVEASTSRLQPLQADPVAQNNAIDTPQPSTPRLRYVFEYSPYFSAALTPDEIVALIEDPRVVSIAEVPVLEAQLPRSTTAINVAGEWSDGFEGSGMAVAVLDTGFDMDHPFIRDRITVSGCFSNPPIGLGNSRCALSGPNAGYYGDSGHGTHVASTAAGGQNFAALGTTFDSVAPLANIWAIQVFSDLYGYNGPRALLDDQKAALQAILDNLDLDPTAELAAVNMSLGGGRYFGFCPGDHIEDEIQLLRNVGVAVVIASGNEEYRDSVASPACIDAAITVGATGFDSQVASYSNIGPQVDLLAPGGDFSDNTSCNDLITAAWPPDVSNPYYCYADGFGTLQGTSMAAPHVAGAIAVLRSRFPAASVDNLEAALETTGTAITDTRIGGLPGTYPLIDVGAASDWLSANIPFSPIADTDTAIVHANADPLDITVIALSGDRDPNAGDVLSISAINTNGTTGSVTLAGGVLTYDPNDQFENLAHGASTTDTFTYTVRDPGGLTDTAEFTVNVQGVDDDPPTLSISGPSGPVSGAFTASFTFSEDVTGFTLG
ncbi:S8 family serine peptidase, partial [Hyphobacterium sp. HN65]